MNIFTIPKTILIPLSADPFHRCHFELIKKATLEIACGGKVIVAITNNDLKEKTYLFTLEERFLMAKKAIEDNDYNMDVKNIEVIMSEDLVPDLYLEYNCDFLVSGYRNQEDLDYETKKVAQFKLINPKIVGHCIPIHGPFEWHYELVSSTLIKSFAKKNVDISKYVPLFIKRAVEEKLNLQLKFGMVGEDFEQVKKTALDLKLFIQNNGSDLTLIDFEELLDSVYKEVPGPHDKCSQVNFWAQYRKLMKDKTGFIAIVCKASTVLKNDVAQLVNGNMIFVGENNQEYIDTFQKFIKAAKTGSTAIFNPLPKSSSLEDYEYSLRRLRREVAKIFTPEGNK